MLATATPVQMYPVEAWDLLQVISVGTEHILGNSWSHWRKAREAIGAAMTRLRLPEDDHEAWGWIRNPLPFSFEGREFEMTRRSLEVGDDVAVIPGDAWDKLRAPDRARIRSLGGEFLANHNPFIRHIVRRTREYLETTINPETNEPFLKPVRVELLGEAGDESITLPPYLRDAYEEAEEFCKLLGHRVKGSGFMKTLMLRRVGSTIYAGRMTATKILESWESIPEVEEEEDAPDYLEFKSLTSKEREHLQRFVAYLDANQERDPKYEVVVECLKNRRWLQEGCIVFSQYFDSVWWLAEQLTVEFPEERIGVYGGAQRSGMMHNGEFESIDRESIKRMVQIGEVRLLLGTDAASEGLNLQKLGTLINLDLPWNPTRLEQRKGRIQRIGQVRDTVFVYNMRYSGSVEDRVHQLLSNRLASIFNLFGQIPDILEDVWIDMALGEIERARQTIEAVPQQHPFAIKYRKVENLPWETCAKVLAASERKRCLSAGW